MKLPDFTLAAVARARTLPSARRAASLDALIVLMAPTDFPILKALADVGADVMTKCGLNVDYQALDWGTLNQRRVKKDPVDAGGWSCFFTAFAGTDMLNPAGHLAMRANGADAWIGWPDSPKLEQLRTDWFVAPDVPAQQKIAQEIQVQAFQDVPYLPLGQYLQATAYNTALSGVNNGFAMFWNVRRG